MLSRLRNARAIQQYGVLNDCKPIRYSSLQTYRWQSGTQPPTTDPNLSYMRNPGTSPLLDTTVGKLLESAAQKWPDHECLVSLHQGVRMSYSQLLKRADKIAAGFKEIGLKKGDRIGIWSPNNIEWIVTYMGATRAGLIIAGINPAYTQAEVDYCVRKIGARAIVAPESFREQNYADMLLQVKKTSTLDHVIVASKDHVPGTRRLLDIEELAGRKDVEAVKEEQVEISPYSGTNIQFTSGTTGNPKATLLSHRSLVNNARQAYDRLQVDHHKSCLNVPLFHAFGMIMGIVAPLHTRSCVVLENPTFNPVASVEAIIAEKCKISFGTPTMWTNMVDVQIKTGAKIDSLVTGLTGGASASPNLFRSIREHLRLEHIKSIYGLTEVTAIVNQSVHEEPKELTETTVGYISDHIEIKIVDEKGDVVPFGSAGELYVRGYSTMMGYWGDEENTRKTITEDEWLKTGDQYILRKDGYGLVVGRLKDMLIRGGENIFPKEIEHFLETHPAIAEVYVFGVHDDIYGEEICACIRLRTGAMLTAGDVVKYCKGNIANFKIPRYIIFREDYPKTASGKIQKFKLRQELEERDIVPKKPESG